MESTLEKLNSCPLCGNDQLTNLPTPNRWIGREIFEAVRTRVGLNKCKRCSLVFNNPRPSEELLTNFYNSNNYTCHDHNYDESISNTSIFIHKTMSRLIQSESKPKLLDYGCGGGSYLHNLVELGWDGQGYEIGQAGLESSRSLGLNVTSDINELPTDYFDAVLLNHVFEHIPNPKEVLDGIAPILKRNGLVFIATPNVLSLRARLSAHFFSRHLGFDERHRAFPIHLFYYSHNTLPKMIMSAGYQVNEVITYGMGVEELLIREGKTAVKSNSNKKIIQKDQGAPTSKKPSRIKNLIKDWFYRNHLGESVMVIASYPK